jgi:hypothetical protein
VCSHIGVMKGINLLSMLDDKWALLLVKMLFLGFQLDLNLLEYTLKLMDERIFV